MSNNQNNNSSNPFGGDDSAGYDFKALLQKLLAKWYLFVIFAGIGFAIAYAYNRVLFSRYKVESTILAADYGEAMGSVLFENLVPQKGTNLENEVGILSSYGLHRRTLSKLDFHVNISKKNILGHVQDLYGKSPISLTLDINKPFVANKEMILSVTDDGLELKAPGSVYQIYNPVTETYTTNNGEVNVKLKEGPAQQTALGLITVNVIDPSFRGDLNVRFKSTEELVKSYVGAVKYDVPENWSTILRLSMESTSTVRATTYLSALMNQYLDEELIAANETAENIVNFIDSQLDGISDSLDRVENRMVDYRTSNQIFNLSSEGASIYGRLQDLEEQKAVLEISLRYYETLAAYVSEERYEELMVPSLAGVSEPVLNQLVGRVLEQQGKLSSMRLSLTRANPELMRQEEQFRIMLRTLDENLRQLLINTRNQVRELNNRISRINQEVNALPATERGLMSIQRKFTINEGIYNYLLQRRAESAISKAATRPQNNILDEPRVVGSVFPKRDNNLMMGVLIGFFIPGLFIFVKDFFRKNVESQADVKRYLDMPIIGNVPRSKVYGDLAVYNFPKSHVTESYRSIRANFKYLFPDQNMKTIFVTSAQPQDGKTFTSINLASIFALSGKKTVLVGLDLRKPKLHNSFDYDNKVGLTSYLIGQKSFDEVVRKTEYDNLHLVLSGPIPPNPAELILTNKFKTFIAALKEQFDIVILDTPPVGVVSETLDIMGMSDVGLFVARQNQTSLAALEASKDILGKTGFKSLYVVYNDSEDVKAGYAYGYYGDETEDQTSKKSAAPIKI